jgi:hypothetical protein
MGAAATPPDTTTAIPIAPAIMTVLSQTMVPTGRAMPRLIAAQLESVHRVLYDEAMRRCLAGQSRAGVWAVLAGAAPRAFGLLEPALAGIGAR